jgi:hypothetical protein
MKNMLLLLCQFFVIFDTISSLSFNTPSSLRTLRSISLDGAAINDVSMGRLPVIVAPLNRITEDFLQYFSSKYKVDVTTNSKNAISVTDASIMSKEQATELSKVKFNIHSQCRYLLWMILILSPLFSYLYTIASRHDISYAG